MKVLQIGQISVKFISSLLFLSLKKKSKNLLLTFVAILLGDVLGWCEIRTFQV